MAAWVGVDVGGTFTDVAVGDEAGHVRVGKVLTTPGEEQVGVLAGLDAADVDPGDIQILIHGTTLVINALLERKGASVALITTRGFRDTHELGRSNRPQSFNWFYHRDAVLIPRHRRYEVSERTLADGTVEATPDASELDALADGLRAARVNAIAVAFLNAYVNPDNEQYVASDLRRRLPDTFVTTSSDLSRAWREYERFTTAAANAYVGPATDTYLRELERQIVTTDFDGDFLMIDSSGGALRLANARRYPVRLIESGPAGGVLGAARLAADLGLAQIVTFDMGGTTAKSAALEDGVFPVNDLYWVGGYDTGFPLQIPSIDVVEVGAGGGSIASLNAGRLAVGPRSAGASPGPACYGRGGTDVTVTDANLFAGRLLPKYFLASIDLDGDAATAAVERLARSAGVPPMRLALGVLSLADLSMANVVRQQTLQRGRDPREFVMVAFGGAGPLHACLVAAEVGIQRVLVPPAPGHFSAMGMLSAVPRFSRQIVLQVSLDELETAQLRAALVEAAADLEAVIQQGATVDPPSVQYSYSLALRYLGQENTLMVRAPVGGLDVPPSPADEFAGVFVREYQRRFGHTQASPVELVGVTVEAAQRWESPASWVYQPERIDIADSAEVFFGTDQDPHRAQVLSRTALVVDRCIDGPALIYEAGSMTVVPPGATLSVAPNGCLDILLGRGQ